MNKDKHSISDDVMERIKNGEIHMRPAIYFSLLSSLTVVAGIFAGIAMAYISSIIFFWIKTLSINAKAYGLRRNLAETIAAFPWWTVIIFCALTALTVLLVRRYGHIYKHRTRYIILTIIAVATIAGFIMSSFGIGDLNHSGRNSQGTVQKGPWWQNK